MMNFINMIPESIGWAMVGATAMLCAVVIYNIGKCVVEAIKTRIEDANEEEAE